MLNIFRNIILLISVLVLSYFTAPYFGYLYDVFDPQMGGAFWGLDKHGAVFFAGFIISYILFVPLIFELLGKMKKDWWAVGLLIPVLLFYLYANTFLIYFPILIAIIGYLLGKFINIVIRKIFKIDGQVPTSK